MFGYYRILVILAILPGAFLIGYVYKLDKIEKEPTRLLVKLFIAGVVSTFVAAILEMIGDGILSGIFYEGSLIYNLIENFIVVACVEEGVKYFCFKKIAWKSPEFDYRFDAVVYAVCVGLGFGIFENVQYAVTYGLSTVLMRAVTAIPAHFIFGVFMGHYFGQAKYYEQCGDEAASASYRKSAYLVPVLLHGIYDFTAGSENGLVGLIFLIFVIGLDIAAYRKLKQDSAEDEHV